MLRLKTIEQNHQDSLKTIKSFLDDESPEMRAITKLLCETDVNPYSFLPHEFANGFNTSSGFESLLHMIHHALVDDGEISFPVVNGEPRIIFVSAYEHNYEDYALNETEKYFKQKRGNTYNIEVCASVFDFIELFEDYNSVEVRRWFIADASRRGIDFAVEHYSCYARFNPAWEFDDTILAEIARKRNELRALGIVKD